MSRQNWYTCFDPAGPYGNVHFLLAGMEESRAGRIAQNIAQMLRVPHVTTKRIHKGEPK